MQFPRNKVRVQQSSSLKRSKRGTEIVPTPLKRRCSDFRLNNNKILLMAPVGCWWSYFWSCLAMQSSKDFTTHRPYSYSSNLGYQLATTLISEGQRHWCRWKWPQGKEKILTLLQRDLIHEQTHPHAPESSGEWLLVPTFMRACLFMRELWDRRWEYGEALIKKNHQFFQAKIRIIFPVFFSCLRVRKRLECVTEHKGLN